MPRCSSCNKFVSIEMADPELDLSVEDEVVTGTVRLVKTCAECGAELAEATPDVEIADFEFTHAATEDCDGELELENESVDNDERAEGKGRGARTFYGANITAEIVCQKCGARATVEGSAEVQASDFESLE